MLRSRCAEPELGEPIDVHDAQFARGQLSHTVMGRRIWARTDGGAGVTGSARVAGRLAPRSTMRPGDPSAPSTENCAPAAYSVELDLCYDPANGDVWDVNQGTWTLPPQVDWCGPDERSSGNLNYCWPLLPACYSPVSGYAWNIPLGRWVFVGTNFTQGQATTRTTPRVAR